MDITITKQKNIEFLSFSATGTHWSIVLDPSFKKNCKRVKSIITSRIINFEQRYSRFKDNSILDLLRKTGEYKNPPEDFIIMLKLGLELQEITKGHFNLSIGNYLEDKGYNKEYSFKSEKKQNNYKKDWLIELNEKFIKIIPGTQLDFGSFGKGYLIDLLFNDLLSLEFNSIIINAGGDIYYFSKEKKLKKFILENPFNPSEYIGEIEIVNSSISSSSNNRRRWEDKNTGETHSHLNSSLPEHQIKIASVYTHSKTAIISDAIATCLFVSPESLHRKIAAKYKTEYLLVFEDGKFMKSKGYKGILNF